MNQWWHDKQAKKPAAAVVTSAPIDGSGGDGPGSGAVTAPVPAATVLPVAPMMDGAAGIIAAVASSCGWCSSCGSCCCGWSSYR